MRTLAACSLIVGLVAVMIFVANSASFTKPTDAKTAIPQGISVPELQEQIDVKSLPVLDVPDTI